MAKNLFDFFDKKGQNKLNQYNDNTFAETGKVKLFRACISPKYQLSLSVYQEEAQKNGRNKKVIMYRL